MTVPTPTERDPRAQRSSVAIAAALVALAALARWIPHPPNFAPIGAMALFGGAVMGRPLFAFGVPLAAMALSDLLLNVWYLGSPLAGSDPWVYASFLLVGLIGTLLRKRRSMGTLAGASLAGSLLFFLLTNFGVWAGGRLYPRTPEGLAACFTAAIPFFRNTLFGDLFWNAALFGAWGVLVRGGARRAAEGGVESRA